MKAKIKKMGIIGLIVLIGMSSISINCEATTSDINEGKLVEKRKNEQRTEENKKNIKVEKNEVNKDAEFKKAKNKKQSKYLHHEDMFTEVTQYQYVGTLLDSFYNYQNVYLQGITDYSYSNMEIGLKVLSNDAILKDDDYYMEFFKNYNDGSGDLYYDGYGNWQIFGATEMNLWIRPFKDTTQEYIYIKFGTLPYYGEMDRYSDYIMIKVKNPYYKKQGWQFENGKWYFYENGVKYKNRWYKDETGAQYFLKNNGEMAQNEELYLGNSYFRFNNAGRMCENEWYTSSGKTYFYKGGGYRAKNEWLEINNNWFRFDSNYVMLENSWYTDQRGSSYYLKSGGYMAKNEELYLGNSYFRFNSAGRMCENEWYTSNGKTYFYKGGGYRARNEWVTISGNKFRFGSDYVMLENKWFNENGKDYWLKKGGYMAKNEIVYINNVGYKFDINGLWIGYI